MRFTRLISCLLSGKNKTIYSFSNKFQFLFEKIKLDNQGK